MPVRQGVRARRSTRALTILLVSVLASFVFAPRAAAENTSGMPWHLEAMNAEEMWKSSKGKGITVAILDSGVDRDVPELRGQVLDGKNFFDSKISAHEDHNGHGTSMAGLVNGTGKNGGVRGLAPSSKVLPVTVLEAVDIPIPADLPGAIDYAVDQGANIINMSFGGDGMNNKEVQESIDRANRKNVLLFAATGNDGSDEPRYPAAMPGVVAVGAGDKNGNYAEFSQHGKHLALSAPGAEIPVRCKNRTVICKANGTSAASAIASASAALIWSKYPDWTANQVLRVMLETAGRVSDSEGPSKYIGYGAVRPRIALAGEDINPGDPDKNPLFPKYYAKEQDTKKENKETQNPNSENNDSTSTPTSSEEPEEDGYFWPLAALGAVVLLSVGVVAMRWKRR